MSSFYINPKKLSNVFFRDLLKIISFMYNGKIYVNYKSPVKIYGRDFKLYRTKVHLYIPKEHVKSVKRILKHFGLLCNAKRAEALMDYNSVIMDLLYNKVSKIPLGLSLKGTHFVSIPSNTNIIIENGDFRFGILISSFFNNIIWIENRGLDEPLSFGFKEIDSIPINKLSQYGLREFARVVSELTIGKNYATEIFNFLSSETDISSDVELPLGGKSIDVINEILSSGLMSREGNLPSGKLFIDTSDASVQSILSLLAAVSVLPFMIIFNCDFWHKSINPILERRSGVIWIRERYISEPTSFEYIISRRGDFYTLERFNLKGPRIVTRHERFLPLWEVL